MIDIRVDVTGIAGGAGTSKVERLRVRIAERAAARRAAGGRDRPESAAGDDRGDGAKPLPRHVVYIR